MLQVITHKPKIGYNFVYRQRGKITKVFWSGLLISKSIYLFIKILQWHLWKGSCPFLHPQRNGLIPVLVVVDLPMTQMPRLYMYTRHYNILLETKSAPRERTVMIFFKFIFSPDLQVSNCSSTEKLNGLHLSPFLTITPQTHSQMLQCRMLLTI